MKSIKRRFNTFYYKFPYLDIKELIENFAVFEGICITNIRLRYDIFENIEENIVKNYHVIKKEYQSDELEEKILQKLALGDRKQYALYRSNRDISQMEGRVAYKKLYEKKMIKKERSREEAPKKEKYKLLKKEFRGYTPEDKIKFTKNFDRFWYTFIVPFKNELDIGKTDEFKNNLYKNFDKFVSLTFEELSNELLKEESYKLNIIESGGYWDKRNEFDILAKDINGDFIVGECKWTNQKICRNLLTKLKNKAKYLNFPITNFALFSKNGFSSSLLKKSEAILFDLNDFKVLLNDR